MLPSGVKHIVAANEGGSIALSIGSYLATAKPAVVYMQNSGIGNAINPLISLADKRIYGIPIFLIIGWRGEPGTHDEPQHIKQGLITPEQLNLLDIDHRIVDQDADIKNVTNDLWSLMLNRSHPVALLIKDNTFSAPIKPMAKIDTASHIKNELEIPLREEAIEKILNLIESDSLVICSTGKSGRELYEIRDKNKKKHFDFLTVGGMGHASMIALGVALSKPSRQVICLDGDGALLMHLGSLTTIGTELSTQNLTHILLNNGCHESVGGQLSAINNLNIEQIVTGCNYEYFFAKSLDEIEYFFNSTHSENYSKVKFLEIQIRTGSRSDLGRPKISPWNNKLDCMRHLSDG